jgi:hypothetical protein
MKPRVSSFNEVVKEEQKVRLGEMEEIDEVSDEDRDNKSQRNSREGL